MALLIAGIAALLGALYLSFEKSEKKKVQEKKENDLTESLLA